MTKSRTPAIFIGHGSPMSALPGNVYGSAWQAFGRSLKKPKAILIISAHWNIAETAVSDSSSPRQIYDFYGFPEEMYELKYNPPGSPTLAARVRELLRPLVEVKVNNEWGLDHGAWVPLRSLFPKADIPVVQLSLNYELTADFHYQIGQALKPLRDEGILIIGSGDLVHNLGIMKYDEAAAPFTWADNFENKVRRAISLRDHASLINYHDLPDASLAVPTPEHYLPLLYILALQEEKEGAQYFVEGIAHGSVSMSSFILK